MFLVVLVINNPSICHDVMDAWDELGVPGGTILDSLGMQQARKSGARDDIPLLAGMSNFLKSSETRHRTIFSVVPNREMVDQIAAVTQEIIGDFEQENTGFMFSTKVDQVYGLRLS